MKIERVWAMPTKWTFGIKPISELLKREISGSRWIDPFAGENGAIYADYANNLDKDGIDALDFLKGFPDNFAQGVLFDPPYSVEQCLRKYTPKFKGTAGRAEYWAKCKDEIARILMPGGKSICFGWDSCGIGSKRGFKIIEVLLVCHGACHNDTICTVEIKTNDKGNSALSGSSGKCEHDKGGLWERKEHCACLVTYTKKNYPTCPFCKPMTQEDEGRV